MRFFVSTSSLSLYVALVWHIFNLDY